MVQSGKTANGGGDGSAAISAGVGLVILVVSLFFLWGSMTSLNDLLIPKLKELFQLNHTQAMLIQFAFFTAYAIVGIPAGAIVARLGYGRGIAVGLGLAAIGCLLFVPAASTAIYGLFLGALFILAGGITILQVAANPLIANLGDTKTSHARLTLAQAFNSLGTTIAPLIGAPILLGSLVTVDPSVLTGAELTAYRAKESAVIGQSYMMLALVFVVIAIVFWVVRNRLGQPSRDIAVTGSIAVMRKPRLAFGVAAIFLYVGAEVTIGSLLVNYLMMPNVLGVTAESAGKLIAFYWGGAMVGRFIGAGLLSVFRPGKVLAVAALGAGALCLVSFGAFGAGDAGALAGWSLIGVGLFNSIMFPTIFSLALEGLGERTPQGSGMLCVAIVGGALIPVLSGWVADLSTLGVAMTVPAICYAVIAGFGWYARRPGGEAA